MQDPLIFLSSSSNTHSYSNMASASSFKPKDTKSIIVKNLENGKETKKKEKGKEKTPGHTPTMFITATSKTLAEPSKSNSFQEIMEDEYAPDNDDGGFDNGNDGGDSGCVIDNPTSLINIKLKSNGDMRRGGQPKHSLLDDLLQKCYQQLEPVKHLF
jgi:hypothetical protein